MQEANLNISDLRYAVSTILVNSQYAEFGIDELPQRLTHCIDDLSLYKEGIDSVCQSIL